MRKDLELMVLSKICKTVLHTGAPVRPHQNYTEGIEHGSFTLKTHQIFSVHTTPEKFEEATIAGYFGFVFDENVKVLEYKAPFSICFTHTPKRKAGVFKFLLFEDCFTGNFSSKRFDFATD